MRLALIFLICFTCKTLFAFELPFGIIGDAGRFNAKAEQLLNSMNQMNVKRLIMPGEYFSKTFSFGELQYLVLNSDNTQNIKKQMTWLKASTAKQIYLVYHHRTYKVGRYVPTEQKKNFQLKLRPILKTYRQKITALIVGHEHIA